MAFFTTRIELYSPLRKDLLALYEALRDEGFSNIIRDESGGRFLLPPGEFNKEGDCSKEQVLDMAIRCASKTNREYSILVTESNGRSWAKLPKVK